MIRLEDISDLMQSYIALLRYSEKRGSLSYHIPGTEKPNSIITKNLLKYFLEYCLDTGHNRYGLDDAVVAEARKSMATEKWGTNSDSFDILTATKDRRINCSIYRGIDRMVNNGRMPVYVPQLSLIYDGIEVIRSLQGTGIPCAGEAQKVMQYWHDNEFSRMMQKKALEKPKRRFVERKVVYETIINDKQQARIDHLKRITRR